MGHANMDIGYARTSTTEQLAGLEAQERDLRTAGVERIFREQVSSVARREQLEAMLDFAREGDTVTVSKLDRLARSVRDLMAIVDRLKAKGVTLRILAMNMDTATPTGQLMLTILAGVAQFERELMLERQREGIAKAKAEKKYKGRAPTARTKADEIEALLRQHVGPQEISRRLKISRSSVYRVMKHAGLAAPKPGQQADDRAVAA
jgi:DNA invertase Pin-like site-specific DNA recombinase